MNDTEDYSRESIPLAHAATHQPGGTDDVLAIPKSIVTAAGDLLYATGPSILARLALVADKRLFGNAAGNAPEFSTGIQLRSFTKNTADGSGSQSVTGLTFKPSHVIFIANVDGTPQASIGLADDTQNFCIASIHAQTPGAWSLSTTRCIRMVQSPATVYLGSLTQMNADGFTITWTSAGSKSGTATIAFLAFR